MFEGLLGGGQQDSAMTEAYGLTPEMIQQNRMQMLGNIGMMLMAAGQEGQIGDRAKILAQMPDVLNNSQRSLIQMAQLRDAAEKRKNTTQEREARRQFALKNGFDPDLAASNDQYFATITRPDDGQLITRPDGSVHRVRRDGSTAAVLGPQKTLEPPKVVDLNEDEFGSKQKGIQVGNDIFDMSGNPIVKNGRPVGQQPAQAQPQQTAQPPALNPAQASLLSPAPIATMNPNATAQPQTAQPKSDTVSGTDNPALPSRERILQEARATGLNPKQLQEEYGKQFMKSKADLAKAEQIRSGLVSKLEQLQALTKDDGYINPWSDKAGSASNLHRQIMADLKALYEMGAWDNGTASLLNGIVVDPTSILNAPFRVETTLNNQVATLKEGLNKGIDLRREKLGLPPIYTKKDDNTPSGSQSGATGDFKVLKVR